MQVTLFFPYQQEKKLRIERGDGGREGKDIMRGGEDNPEVIGDAGWKGEGRRNG